MTEILLTGPLNLSSAQTKCSILDGDTPTFAYPLQSVRKI